MENRCIKCRKYGEKLFLKGERCLEPKCALARRTTAAAGKKGVQSSAKRGRKKSEYGIQLDEKQKAKKQYGIRERQMRNNFVEANRAQTATGETLLQRLEQRLDNVVYRIGWANSRKGARQLVNHNHIKVDGKMVNIPSYLVKVKQVIEPSDLDIIKKTISENAEAPKWLKYDKKAFKAEVLNLPSREDNDMVIDEQLIVEFYSK